MKFLKGDLQLLLLLTGNSPVSNLIQEAKNGKAKAKIYVNFLNRNLRQKADTLQGYVTTFEFKDDVWKQILEENVEIKK